MDRVSILGVSFTSDLSWNEHISSEAKPAARKIGFLFRSRRFFTPLQLLTLYKAQIYPCLEYSSHLWRGIPKHSLATLEAIQKGVIMLIDDPILTASLDSLAHPRSVSALSLFYRYYYYHGMCYDELKSVIPLMSCFALSTHFADF